MRGSGQGRSGLAGRLARDGRGVAGIEFALVLPVIALLACGLIEFGRLVLLNQKLQNSAFILADLAARDRTLTEAQLDNMFLAVDNILQPFDLAEEGAAVVSGILVDSVSTPMITWQRTGAGSLTVASGLGEPADAAAIPDMLDMSPGETLIAAEVFYEFRPLFGVTAGAHRIHKMAFVKPRIGTLDVLLP